MSTILKALEKNKNPNQALIIEQSVDTRWKLIATISLLMIVALLVTVIFLLSKPKVEALPTVITVSPAMIKQPPMVDDVIAIEAPKSLVDEVSFITAPLPLDPYNKRQKWISADSSSDADQAQLVSVNKGLQTTSTEENIEQLNSDDLALKNVSSELQQRFALAVELEQGNKISFNEEQDAPVLVASDISSMPAKFQYQVPVMRYDSHVYSTIAKDRWIRINGIDLRVGDHIGDVELLDILPQQSVFRLGKQSFTLESLQDWLG